MTTTKPPFYWKVPTAEKDYMFENVQRIRRTAAQNKNKEPVKATFIPGVTKNSKYAHVSSRVGEFLRSSSTGRRERESGNNLEPEDSSQNKLKSTDTCGKEKSFSVQNRGAAPTQLNRRISRSSTDLSVNKRSPGGTSGKHEPANSAPILRSVHSVHVSAQGPGNYIPRANRKPKGLQIEDESVYNWRFSEGRGAGAGDVVAQSSQSHPNLRGFHRVEYLPCDGICAEETLDDSPAESGRSSSRTSRGINTEETRIIGDLHSLDIQARGQSSERLEGATNSDSHVQKDSVSGTSGKLTGQSAAAGMQHASTNAVTKQTGVHNQKTVSTGSELPHTLGTVPKYLQQRKEEWKVQAEQVAAAVNAADVPPGHILLPEAERLETLEGLKLKYAALIDELNRVPIRIDTMRVRDHKIKLEQQLQKLERGMTIFSRPRVYVKLPEASPNDPPQKV